MGNWGLLTPRKGLLAEGLLDTRVLLSPCPSLPGPPQACQGCEQPPSPLQGADAVQEQPSHDRHQGPVVGCTGHHVGRCERDMCWQSTHGEMRKGMPDAFIRQLACCKGRGHRVTRTRADVQTCHQLTRVCLWLVGGTSCWRRQGIRCVLSPSCFVAIYLVTRASLQVILWSFTKSRQRMDTCSSWSASQILVSP